MGFKGGSLRGLLHPRGQRTGRERVRACSIPSPTPGSVSSGRPAGWTEQRICRPSSCSPPPGGAARGLGDAQTRVCASQLPPRDGGHPNPPDPEPLPSGRRTPRASCGEGASGASDVTGGLSQSQLPFEQPPGIPWSHPGPGVILSTAE